MSNMSDFPHAAAIAKEALTTVGARMTMNRVDKEPFVMVGELVRSSAPEHGIIFDELVLRSEAEGQIQGWIEAAAMHHRNEEFYRGLIYQCGELLGPEVYISDDGSVQDSVLALKVPEMLKELVYPRNRFLRALRILFSGK